MGEPVFWVFVSAVLCVRDLRIWYAVIDYVLEVWRRLKEWSEKSKIGKLLAQVSEIVWWIFGIVGIITTICGIFKVKIERLIAYLHEPVVLSIVSDFILLSVFLLVIAELYLRIDRRLERLEQAPTVKTSSRMKVAYLQCTKLRWKLDDSERCRCVFHLACEYMMPHGCPHRCAFLTLEREPPSGGGAIVGGVIGAALGGVAGGLLGFIGGGLLGLAIGNALEASQTPIKETEALRKYRECERKGCLVVFEIVV